MFLQSRRTRLLITLPLLVLFAWFTGGTIPVLRSLLMISVLFCYDIFYLKPVKSYVTVLMIACVFVTVTPTLIFNPSFLLTFAVLLFSLGLRAVNRMYHIQRIPTVARVILHLICVCALISVCIQTIAHGFATNADLLVFLVIFAVLYVFVCIFVFAAKGSIKREENDAEEYESMFKKTPGKASADHPADKTE